MSTAQTQHSKGYRQYEDIRATLDAYLNAKQDGAYNLALNIRRANPELAKGFDLLDKQSALLPVDRPEGWDT